MKQRNNLMGMARRSAALAALLALAACQNDLPIQRPGGDCGMDPQPACVTISVGTKPAEEKTVAYGTTTPATDAGTRTDDATRADATTRTDLTGKWQVGDQIVVSLQYYSDTEGTNPKNLLHTTEQTLTYKHIEGETAPAGSSPRYWTPDPELLPLPQGVRSIRVTYRYRGSQAMTNEEDTGNTSGDATIVKAPEATHTLVLGRELMAGHLEASDDPTARAGIASITAPDDATQDGCTSLVVISDPTAAIQLPAPRWHRLTTQVRLTGMTPGQMVHLETGTMANDDPDGSSYTPTGGISLTAPDAPDAPPASPDSYNARIYFQPAATTTESDKSVLTLYDGALSGSLNSPTPPRYFRIDCQPSHCYSFLASALNLGSAGADAQVVDGTDGNACLALLTRENPVWVVSGGGGSEPPSDNTDANVLTNVRTALEKIKKDGTISSNAKQGVIDLVLNDVTSLPTYQKNGSTYGALDGYSSLRSVIAPSVTSIGASAFWNSSKITTISLPLATGSIGDNTFNACHALTTISLPLVNGGIGKSAFNSCEALTTADLSGVTGAIGEQAFRSCKSLTAISMPLMNGAIGESAFNGCKLLTTANLPLATDIGESAFSSCEALTTANLPQATDIGESAFYWCTALTTANLPQATGIGKSAFYWCEKLTELNLPAAESIGQTAFYNCSALTKLDLSAAKSIGKEAFYSCTALTELDLPAATSIGESAFYGCEKLTKLNLPAVTNIEKLAFSLCYDLTELHLTTAEAITVKKDAFTNFSTTKCTLYLNSNKESGITSPFWENYIWKEIKFETPSPAPVPSGSGGE